jgi:hypothetical protein
VRRFNDEWLFVRAWSGLVCGYSNCRNGRRTGLADLPALGGWMGLLVLVPMVNLILLYFLAFADWPAERRLQTIDNFCLAIF